MQQQSQIKRTLAHPRETQPHDCNQFGDRLAHHAAHSVGPGAPETGRRGLFPGFGNQGADGKYKKTTPTPPAEASHAPGRSTRWLPRVGILVDRDRSFWFVMTAPKSHQWWRRIWEQPVLHRPCRQIRHPTTPETKKQRTHTSRCITASLQANVPRLAVRSVTKANAKVNASAIACSMAWRSCSVR